MGVAKRKRTRTKVRRKIKNPRNVFVKDINMRETWDSKRTVQQNYAALNLAFAKRASDKRKLEEEREAKIEAGEAPIDESGMYTHNIRMLARLCIPDNTCCIGCDP
eukprot:TRINITY_DN6207_c0_g1_i1.p1 TRINITY_DN6207_c0_g1~~TRINITY_DN6207_c0_g1_i1.p1  ORF type:complete len:106 (-),score=14.85 TRINITY_DN6207_c0_g1_i1:60-377(-)